MLQLAGDKPTNAEPEQPAFVFAGLPEQR